MMRIVLFLPLFALSACQTAAPGAEPSLARRAAENIDPRTPVEVAVDSRPAQAGLVARIAALVAEAEASAAAFAAAEPGARSAAAAAGAAQSESWIAAQLALSELERTRAPFTRALAQVDELRSASARGGTASPADVGAMESAAARLQQMGERQVEALDAIRAIISR
ncbi:MAG TPA: hypothetical protein VFO42_05645 [Sphingomicrobium sp.]|nr:hypothetical protein [Sphingomicrobium sp.]